MPTWIVDLSLESRLLLGTVYSVTAAVLVFLIVPLFGVRQRTGLRFAISGVAAAVGAGAGLAAPYLLNAPALFGVTLSTVILCACAGAGAGLAVAIVNLVRSSWWRRAIAILAVPLIAASTALIINDDVGYYPTVGDAFGLNQVGTLPVRAGNAVPLNKWRPSGDLPSTGEVYRAKIPGTLSHFTARDAWIYLPPAARVANPPRLPVVVMLSGEPGDPSDPFYGGQIGALMDSVAARHHGTAPIVVSPDQLGKLTNNPMCVDSKLGNVRTYLMQDVRHWILGHLPVETGRTAWTIGGFSEGGTCSIQLGAAYPTVFGSILDISGELAPLNGSVAHTIKVGFGGSAAAYKAASPLTILRAHKYVDTDAYFAVGALDTKYGPATTTMAAAAKRAGMRVSTYRVPDYSHNWNTAEQALIWGVGELTPRWHLPTGPFTSSGTGSGPTLPTLKPGEKHHLK
ncbi:alpha/beta hydrolase [Amnibacterium kyonggiense]